MTAQQMTAQPNDKKEIVKIIIEMVQQKTDIYHSLKIDEERCFGCSLCMNICPTKAIRVRNGKAKLMDDRCIDCGECYKICPVKAIVTCQDDFEQIFNFKNRVALVPAVFFGQFPSKYSMRSILDTLHSIGFTHVFEIEYAVQILREAIRYHLTEISDIKPLISTFCPAIVRLIQVKFPSLVNNFLLLKPPLDVAAIYLRKHLGRQGNNDSETGIFYIAQCAAKMTAIKSPAENEISPISGVINMDSVYNKVLLNLKPDSTGGFHESIDPDLLAPEGILWGLTAGESDQALGRRMAIDGIHNVIAFLEKLEKGETSAFDFLELRACDESCAGGVLTPEHRFLTVERLKNRARRATDKLKGRPRFHPMKEYRDEMMELISLPKINPRSINKLDENVGEAQRKNEMIVQIMQSLPNVDCGACGSPGCQALAEDIVQGRGLMENCIFVQRQYEHTGKLDPVDATEIMKKVWGEDKFGNKSEVYPKGNESNRID